MFTRGWTAAQVSALVGEPRMWQLTGDLPDKERSYLAERLKYSSRDAQASPMVCIGRPRTTVRDAVG